jgi:type II secretory pathway predicted ATPase ExeA
MSSIKDAQETDTKAIVLEAASGTGKSTEARAQSARLRREGLLAFYCEARRVATDGLLRALSEDDCELLKMANDV